MIKIAALNEELEEDSNSEEEVTKEALEQIALQQYNKALDLQRKGNLPEATQLLKDLLDTELLYDVKKPLQGEKTSGPLYSLKYLCYKNLASMLKTTGEIEAAIEAYNAASELDDTDVTLWHRMGLLCMQAERFETALHAFQRGVECNPHHWPCLDKIITLLLGLDYKEECISTIYEALQLDPGYLRGLIYRRYIFTDFPYIRRYMEYLNPIYKWNESDDGSFDEDYTLKFLKEATEINDIFIEQQKAEQFKYVLPILKLKKPITKLTWGAVGDSLVYMHQYMTDNCFSHACRIELVYEKEEIVEAMDVCEEIKIDLIDNKLEETNTDTEKNMENFSENENNDLSDKDKAATDTEKVESDLEMAATTEPNAETPPEPKKKQPVRRRGSVLRSLKQWGWCEPRPGRKKPANKETDNNIYDMLRRLVPLCLSPENVQKKDNQKSDIVQGTNNLEFNDNKVEENLDFEKYFGTDSEQKDVEQFINKYIDSKHDIIDILKEYLAILANKWRVKWPGGLSKTFIEANKCYNNHIEVPSCTDTNKPELIHYCFVNMLVEEFSVNDKLNSIGNVKQSHGLNVVDTIGLCLTLKPHIFSGEDCLELMLRHLWVKLHINVLNKCDVLALECLYQLSYEFEAMGECCSAYCLNIVNFVLKPIISYNEISEYIKFLERNKKLSTVMELYEKGNYEEVLDIVIDSFEHCKTMTKEHEDEMSLDFSVQLSLILDTFWALGKVDECFMWSLTCLHEALKHYFRYTSGSPDYERWTLTVVKVLCCMEHILTTEGLLCLEAISEKQLSQGLDDLIRIIGHQVETNASEMPFGTVVPWIVMHYILQREEDQGRGRTIHDAVDEIPNPLMVLFIAHEQLGSRGWCSTSDCKLLFFILDTVVPRLRSPYLSKSLEQISQYMEQCVYCLFGHPGKKNKIKYLTDHNISPQPLNWKTAQQLYEIFRPQNLPAIEGKVPAITTDTEQLFHRILALLPSEADPQKYLLDLEKYLKGQAEYLPVVQTPLPYKMRDIYFLLGDYYFKKEEGKMAIKFNMLDIILNNNRLESWAEISLAKAVNLDRILNSCKNLNNERDYLNPAKSIIKCFKRAVALDPTHCNMWIEYGIFVYTVHSFCSRLLKQASESLSMEDFESLEKQKEEMLDTTQKCFTTVLQDLNSSTDTDKENEDTWLNFYMLGKVAEKRNKPPSVFLNYYIKGVQSLQETSATYPLKINSSSPTHLCIEVLELHYRIHASILKYIEQHENKPIPASVGKVFSKCIEQWKNGPFSKKYKKDLDCDVDVKSNDPKTSGTEPVQAANILKRSISDAGEEDTSETKRLRLEAAAAKVRRSASYDTERLIAKESGVTPNVIQRNINKPTEQTSKESSTKEELIIVLEENENASDIPKLDDKVDSGKPENVTKQINNNPENKEDNSSSSSSTSSSDSSSSESSSDSSSESSRDSDTSQNTASDDRPLTEDEIMKIVGDCLDALEDCASRFSPHYKAIYRLCHYHFYYKKGKNIDRCRDLMLSNFTTRSGQKLAGLFSERKHSNFFNNIWKILTTEVDRAGSFAFHMNRCVLLTMEILKEIDDHKTLLDLSLHLQRIPEPDKKYLRDSDREELAQQAFSLCVQSLKGQLVKFSQQADLKSNDVERQALKSLMLDIYRAYQRAQKQPNSKQFTSLLVDAYKLVTTTTVAESPNLVDLSMKYCQSLIQTLRQQATQASLDKSQNYQKKQAAKAAEIVKPPVASFPKADHKAPSTSTTTAPSLPKMSSHEMSAAFQSYLPMLSDPLLSQQTAAALSLSYLSNISALAGYSSLQNTLQSSLQSTLQNSFQAEFYRQFLGQNLPSFNPHPVKKLKRGPKPGPRQINPQSKSKPFRSTSVGSIPKSTTMSSLPSLQKTNSANIPSSISSVSKSVVPTPAIANLQKSNAPILAPSMGTVLSSLPASMTAGLSYGPSHPTQSSTNVHSSIPSQAHLSSASAVTTMVHSNPPTIHQQASPVKTLQEKLAERQKNLPLSKMNAQEINALNRLPASLTITKTGPSKQTTNKKPELKKAISFSEAPKPISSDEVIVLDDD